jgi:hypothetical protein
MLMTDGMFYTIAAINVVTAIIVILMVMRNAGGVFATVAELKRLSTDFPTQGGQVVVALALILMTGVIIAVRLAIGRPFPDGYENWLMFLGVLSGITNVGMIGKRATDRGLAAIKAGGGPAVAVESAGTVTVEQPTAPAPPSPPSSSTPSTTGAPIVPGMMPSTSATSAGSVSRDD